MSRLDFGFSDFGDFRFLFTMGLCFSVIDTRCLHCMDEAEKCVLSSSSFLGFLVPCLLNQSTYFPLNFAFGNYGIWEGNR